MPQRTKKDHKCSHHTERGSRWHNFHFSGKVIVCSVILGFMLILVGGILMAIGMDRDEDTTSNKYDDLQKKPPMVFVGPAIMGIGGFAVIVGVLMCLIETKVCRKRNPDSSPLINAVGEQTEVKEVDGAVNDSEATAIPSTSRHHHDKHRNGARKKSPSPRKSKGSKKPHSSREKNQSTSPSSPSDASGSKSPKFLTASDTFLTPPNSFTDVDPALQKQRDKENQATTSLNQSFTSSGKSWNTSTEFQTPSASFVDDPMSLQFMDRKEEEMPSKENHEFVTPLNSDAGILSTPLINKEKQIQERGGTRLPNDGLASPQQNIQKIIISSEATAHKTEDSGKESNQPGSQGKPGESEIPFHEKSCSSGEIEPTGENDNHLINLQLETDQNALSPEGIESDTASSEKNKNHLKENADDVDELVNKNIEENISHSIKDESTNDNVEEDSKETSGSNTASNSLNSGETTEDASQLNSIDIESINEHLEEASEITPTSSDVGTPVDTPT